MGVIGVFAGAGARSRRRRIDQASFQGIADCHTCDKSHRNSLLSAMSAQGHSTAPSCAHGRCCGGEILRGNSLCAADESFCALENGERPSAKHGLDPKLKSLL
jgi:hypothetical protein